MALRDSPPSPQEALAKMLATAERSTPPATAPATPSASVTATATASSTPRGDGFDVAEDELRSLQLFIENALDLMLKGNATNYQYLIRQLGASASTSSSSSSSSSSSAVATLSATRRRIFLALPRCISAMAREPKAFHHLLDVLFKFDFLGDADEIRAYTQFLIHLVSSNTVYVVPALQMLVRNLCRPQRLPPALAAAVEAAAAAAAAPPPPSSSSRGISIGSSFGAPVTTPAPVPVAVKTTPTIDVEAMIQTRFASVHATLQRVLALVPTATNALFPVLAEHFPHKRLDAANQTAFLRNVLAVSLYVPSLQERILALIVDRLVAVDVEIQLDDKDGEHADELGGGGPVFTMDDFLDDDLLPADGDGAHLDEMADKLDQMMVIMFEHIEKRVLVAPPTSTSDSASALALASSPRPPQLDAEQAALVFQSLLKIFEHSILNTHRSKYPQFLLFFVCRLDPQFQDVWISQLLSASLDPQTPPVMRRACGAYLASFLARAKYISVAYLQKALYHLLRWMHEQMDLYDAAVAAASERDEQNLSHETATLEQSTTTTPPAHRGFHEGIYVSTLQTVCYLVCYRGLEVAQMRSERGQEENETSGEGEEDASDSTGYAFLRSLGWERLLITSSAYCPLALIQPTVAIEFLNFAESFDLVSEQCIDQVDQAISSMGKQPKRHKSMERTAAPPTRTSTPRGEAATGKASASTTSTTTSLPMLGQRQPLETFFPFDPYLLRRSFRFIGPLYLYWKHVDPTSSENADALAAVKTIIQEYQENNPDENEEDDNEDDEDEDDEDEEIDGAEAMSLVGSAPMVNGSSFSAYRLSATSPDVSMSVGSSLGAIGYDGFNRGFGEDEDDDDDELDDDGDYDDAQRVMITPYSRYPHQQRNKRLRTTPRSKRTAPPRTAFAPSPALSASSPPSQLPPLSGFMLGSSGNALGLGDDDLDDDDGF